MGPTDKFNIVQVMAWDQTGQAITWTNGDNNLWRH